MAIPQTVFHGDEDETKAIVEAVANNCACTYTDGIVTGQCAPHHMLVTDQRALNGLVWMRRAVSRLRREEFGRKKK